MTNRVHVVAEDDGGPTFVRGDVFHFRETFFLKLGVADGQNLVDEENLRVEVRGDGEGKPHVHAARVTFYRRVEKSFDLSEGNYLVEFSLNFRARHSEDRAVEEN